MTVLHHHLVASHFTLSGEASPASLICCMLTSAHLGHVHVRVVLRWPQTATQTHASVFGKHGTGSIAILLQNRKFRSDVQYHCIIFSQLSCPCDDSHDCKNRDESSERPTAL